jgi:hypothetical protein
MIVTENKNRVYKTQSEKFPEIAVMFFDNNYYALVVSKTDDFPFAILKNINLNAFAFLTNEKNLIPNNDLFNGEQINHSDLIGNLEESILDCCHKKDMSVSLGREGRDINYIMSTRKRLHDFSKETGDEYAITDFKLPSQLEEGHINEDIAHLMR